MRPPLPDAPQPSPPPPALVSPLGGSGSRPDPTGLCASPRQDLVEPTGRSPRRQGTWGEEGKAQPTQPKTTHLLPAVLPGKGGPHGYSNLRRALLSPAAPAASDHLDFSQQPSGIGSIISTSEKESQTQTPQLGVGGG